MEAPVLRWYDRAGWQWLLVFVWVCAVLACAGYALQQVVYRSAVSNDIQQLFPLPREEAYVRQLLQSHTQGFANRVVFLLRADSREASVAQARALRARIGESGRLALDATDEASGGASQVTELTQFYQAYHQQLLAPHLYASLADGETTRLVEETLVALYSPLAAPRPYSFQEDPFNLGGAWIESLTVRPNMGMVQEFVSVDPTGEQSQNPWLLISAITQTEAYDLALQQTVSELVDAFAGQYPDTQLLTSGLVFHTAAGTRNAKREMSTVGLGSMLAILVLVIFVFRSVVPLLFVGACVSTGFLTGLVVSIAVFGQIQMVSLVFGATLIGLAVDYCFHHLVCSHALGSGVRARRVLSKALVIGVGSSVIAFSLQWASAFVALKQIAVFCASGLLGAWAAVMLLGGVYRPPARRAHFAVSVYRRLRPSLPLRLSRRGRVGLIALLLLCFGVGPIALGGVDDRVANLNPSPRQLIVMEQRVQALLQVESTSRFLVVYADNENLLLSRMEALAQELTAQHPATEVRGVHQYLPSVPRQQASFALVNQHLYSPGAALSQLCSQLGGACQPPAHGAFQPLQLTDLLGSPLAKFMPPFGFDTQREQWVGVFLLKGDLSSSAFTDWVAKTPDLFLYDEAALLSTQMASYRQWATGMLALALVLLCGALLLIYRARALRVLPALGLAILVPVALVSVFGGLTVFHVMALLLVVGIGIDTALFYLEAGLNEETWGASSLSALTSMLAFGLLALSQVPILHQFGIIILLGLMVCWAVSPLLHTPRDVHPCEDSE